MTAARLSADILRHNKGEIETAEHIKKRKKQPNVPQKTAKCASMAQWFRYWPRSLDPHRDVVQFCAREKFRYFGCIISRERNKTKNIHFRQKTKDMSFILSFCLFVFLSICLLWIFYANSKINSWDIHARGVTRGQRLKFKTFKYGKTPRERTCLE